MIKMDIVKIGDATLYHGDCLEILMSISEGSIEAIITDPPFSSGARTDAGKSSRGAMTRGSKWAGNWFSHDNMATFGFLYLMRLVGVVLLRVCAANSNAHFFTDWRMYPNLYGALESSGWVVKNLVVWDKNHFGMGTNYRNQHELIIYAEKGQFQFMNRGVGNIITSPRVAPENHPTEKPVELLHTIIQAVPGDLILDPFMGSGTTLRAAKDLGRKAIGIEIEERYCEIAANRMAQGVLL